MLSLSLCFLERLRVHFGDVFFFFIINLSLIFALFKDKQVYYSEFSLDPKHSILIKSRAIKRMSHVQIIVIIASLVHALSRLYNMYVKIQSILITHTFGKYYLNGIISLILFYQQPRT